MLANLDLSPFADHSPAMSIQVGPKNQAEQVKLLLTDAHSARRMFGYDLSQASTEKPTVLLPIDALALSHEVDEEKNKNFDPAQITQFQVQGDFRAPPVDVTIDRIEFVAPTPEMNAARAVYTKRLAAKAKRRQQEAERRRQETDRLLADCPHPEDGPDIRHVGAVTPEIVGLIIQAGQLERSAQKPYVSQPDDQIKKEGKDVLVWEKGRGGADQEGPDRLSSGPGQAKAGRSRIPRRQRRQDLAPTDHRWHADHRRDGRQSACVSSLLEGRSRVCEAGHARGGLPQSQADRTGSQPDADRASCLPEARFAPPRRGDVHDRPGWASTRVSGASSTVMSLAACGARRSTSRRSAIGRAIRSSERICRSGSVPVGQ